MVVSGCEVSEIIPGKVYLGNENDAQNRDLLTRLGVTHILNVTNDVENHFDRQFKYMKISIKDGSEGIRQYFSNAYSFIEEGKVVFVHCREGVSRSATIVVSYLMKKNSWKLNEALEFVEQKRPIVKPHILFWVELNLFQQCLEKK